MKRYIISILIIIFAIAILFWFKNNFRTKPNQSALIASQPQATSNNSSNQGRLQSSSQTNTANANDFQAPLPSSGDRVIKKPFGIFITPQNSPVQPEKFRGYHTGADFEIFPEELNIDVPVSAVCSGKLALKKYASGYGGVAVQSCNLNGSPITIIYGHLKLASISASSGDDIKTGDIIGILGADKSNETNGERKHLHLGFHKGSSISILGYVQSQSELSGWIDPCFYVCHD
jgi:murein DD-endopeptidase MepM/ murein hydrolase activator NlpD